MNRRVLGIDLGTSSVKVVLADEQGRVIASAKEAYPIRGSDEGRFEQNPQDWTRAITRAIDSLSEICDLSQICAAGLSGQMPTLVLIDKATGETAGDAVLWCDSRADDIAADLLRQWGDPGYYAATGIILDGRYLAPMYLWQKAHGFTGNYYILSAKDYLCYWLSGIMATDPSTASGYAVYSLKTGSWDNALCLKAGINPDDLPIIKASCEVVGTILPALAEELGLPADVRIVNGGADSVCGALGLGATSPGTLCQMWGTSTALIALTDKAQTAPPNRYFITPMAAPETYGLEADLLSTGVSFQWMQDIMGDDMMARAQEISAGSEGLFFYPYISGGEQGVLWDPDLRAGLLGLSQRHNLAHIAHALMEGMCFEVRRCVDAFGIIPKEILCTGEASREPYFMQMLADILGMPCASVKDPHGSALGAAFLAGIAEGIWTFEDISVLAGSERLVYKPCDKVHETYRIIYETYLDRTDRMK